MLTQAESFNNECEMNEGGKHDIEFVEAGKDAPEAFQTAEEALNLIAPFIHLPIIFPGGNPVFLGGNHRDKTQIKGKLAGFIAS